MEDRLETARSLLRQALGLIEQERADRRGEKSTVVVLDPTAERIGQLAHEHAAFIEDHGAMTLRDSLDIRRRLYGAGVRGTARFFGDHFEDQRPRRIFYRAGVPAGRRRNDNDSVALTRQGLELAEHYRQHSQQNEEATG